MASMISEHGGVMDTGRIGVRFDDRDREVFGRFCVLLTEKRVSFSLAGQQTVVLDVDDFTAAKNLNLIPDSAHVAPVMRGDKRGELPTRAETEEKLWKYVTAVAECCVQSRIAILTEVARARE